MKQISDCLVMVVDDTEENIDILVQALGDDYELMVATDGPTALTMVESEVPDIILLDIMMPGMDGHEVCQRLKTKPQLADTPVIFLTAMTDIESKAKGFELGAVDYVIKPFEIREVRARVETHLSLMLARQALRLQNETLEAKVEERTHELNLTQETTVEAMAFLAEYRDPETGGHIKRTKHFVQKLAEKLQANMHFQGDLSDARIVQLYKSAPLHDIGKVGIRDDILLKPGKLTEDEFLEMQTHTLIGYSALSLASLKLGENSFLDCAMELARSHHERWDGTGYPDQLVGSQIPVSARIMALADVYDALISKRPYKPPFPHSRALEIIQEARGTQFDLDVVDAFVAINEEFRQIAQTYADYEEERVNLMRR